MKIVKITSKPAPAYDVYIGRANQHLGLAESKWHNPFKMKNESDRDRVITEYRNYIAQRADLLTELYELDGKILGCYCHNDEVGHKMCHGDVLREIREGQLNNSSGNAGCGA